MRRTLSATVNELGVAGPVGWWNGTTEWWRALTQLPRLHFLLWRDALVTRVERGDCSPVSSSVVQRGEEEQFQALSFGRTICRDLIKAHSVVLV